jgi:hypothetical protein
MEVAGSSETSATIYKTTQHHVPEDSSFHTTCCENLKCFVTCGIWRMFCTRDIGGTPSKYPTCSLLLVIFPWFPSSHTTGVYDDYVSTNVPSHPETYEPPGKMMSMENVWQDLKHNLGFLCPSTALWIHVEGTEVKLRDNLWKHSQMPPQDINLLTSAYKMLPKGTVQISHCVSGTVFLKTLVTLCRTSLRVRHTSSWQPCVQQGLRYGDFSCHRMLRTDYSNILMVI